MARIIRVMSTMADTMDFLARQPLPIELKTITVEENGRPVRRPAAELHFTFAVDGIGFTARCMSQGGHAHVEISGLVGTRPYSAENPQGRLDLSAIVESSHSLRYGRFLVDERQQVQFVGACKADLPLTGTTILTAVTQILTEVQPWIGLVRAAEAGVASEPGTPPAH